MKKIYFSVKILKPLRKWHNFGPNLPEFKKMLDAGPLNYPYKKIVK